MWLLSNGTAMPAGAVAAEFEFGLSQIRALRLRPRRANAIRVVDELQKASPRYLEGERSAEHSIFVTLHTCGFQAVTGSRRLGEQGTPRAEWVSRWRWIREYIVKQNIGLVHGCISSFSNSGLDRDELEGEGMFALVRAVDGFNPWRGIRLSTYAYNSIRRALILVAKKATKHRYLMSVALESQGKQEKSTIASDGLRWDRVRNLLQRKALLFSPREAAVLDWRFPTDGGDFKTLGEVGGALGISKERVRQVQQTAVQKLRDALASDGHLRRAETF